MARGVQGRMGLVEVVQALKHLITHPKASLDDLMRFIPGPDLPTGGRIVGLDGIRDAYFEKNLRYSQLAPLDMYKEVNTGNNLPDGRKGWYLNWRTGAGMPVLQGGVWLADKTSA